MVLVRRLFFSLLLCCLSFFAASQDSTVCISPQVARWFLEADDERWVLREKDSLNTQLITNLGDQLLVKDQIIVMYKADSASYESRYVTLLESSTLKQQEIERLEKSLSRRKVLEILGLVAVIVLSVL